MATALHRVTAALGLPPTAEKLTIKIPNFARHLS